MNSEWDVRVMLYQDKLYKVVTTICKKNEESCLLTELRIALVKVGVKKDDKENQSFLIPR